MKGESIVCYVRTSRSALKHHLTQVDFVTENREFTGICLSLALMLQTSQDYPTKRVRLIEPFGAGGGPDLVSRALAQKLTELWGQPMIVENVPGTGATAGPAQAAKSPADGYTLLVNTSAQA
jgi:tripartite-type tricarboxylate transporter receptor subunit TctC